MQISSRLAVLAGLSLALLLPSVLGHGRLVTPVPRDVYEGASSSTQNAPVANDASFVCRNYANRTPVVTMTAGASFTMKWQFDANHVGDSFAYLSYDIAAADTAKNWFKIAEFPKSNLNNGVDVSFTAPAWLKPCDHCILRFEWYALHLWSAGTVELYTQCVDVKIVGPADGVLGTPRVTIPGHLPTTSVTTNYRDPFTSTATFFLTGPALATADGTVTSVVVDDGSNDATTDTGSNSTTSAAGSKCSASSGISKDGVAAVSVIMTALIIGGIEFLVYWMVVKKGVSLSLPRGKATNARSTSPI